MKKILSLLILLITILSFSQEKEYRQAAKLFNDEKYTESLLILDKLLNKEFGELSGTQEFYSLQLKVRCHYIIRDYKKAYDTALSYLAFVKNSNGLFSDDKLKTKVIEEAEKFLASIRSKIPSKQMISSNSNTNNPDKETTQAKTVIDNKTVSLTVSGTGKTLEEAKLNALRSAIEQAFGAFISSKTEILNDSIVKDEIVSVSSGNIQKYDVVSQLEIPNNGYAMTLNATVSIEKLASFAESKGITVEFKGGMFGIKIKLQKIQAAAELKVIENLVLQTFIGLENSIDHSLKVGDNPRFHKEENDYVVDLLVTTNMNSNYYKVWEFFENTIKNISLSKVASDEIKINNHKVYPFTINNNTYVLRNIESIVRIYNLCFFASMLSQNTFYIKNNLGTVKLDAGWSNFFNIQHFSPEKMVTWPEQVDVVDYEQYGESATVSSLLDYIKKYNWSNSLLNTWSFKHSAGYDSFSFDYNYIDKWDRGDKDHQLIIGTLFKNSQVKYEVHYPLDKIEKIEKFELEKISFSDLLNNYELYRNIKERYIYSCFLKGTKISTPKGSKKIEEIKVGDEVICYDDKGNLHTSIVESINEHDNQDVYKYSVWNGEPLFATPNHWVLTSENTFSEIAKLNEMLTLVDIDGGLRPITKVEYYGKEKVYNFIVKDYHTYIANDIKVHNGGKGKYKSKRLVNVKQIIK